MSESITSQQELHVVDMDYQNLSVKQKIKLLVEALDGKERINESLSKSEDSEAMLNILVAVSADMKLGLSREELMRSPPIRDWIWWKNKQSLVTLGEGTLRHQQDSSSKTRWDSWSISFFKFFRMRR